MKLEILFLKVAIFIIAIPVLALCIFGLPSIFIEAPKDYPTYIIYPIIIVIYMAAIPYFVALYQSFKLLGHIKNNKTFSELSIKALNNIKYCAVIISILYIMITPFLYVVVEIEDAPGILAFTLIIIFIAMVISVAASLFQKLLKNVMESKKSS